MSKKVELTKSDYRLIEQAFRNNSNDGDKDVPYNKYIDNDNEDNLIQSNY